MVLLQSQVREDYLYQLCTGFIEAKTTAKLGELCKGLARFLHSQKPYEYLIKFKSTAERVLLTNFVIIELLKENSSGYKLEKAKIDRSVDYDFDIETACTPTQDYPLMRLGDSDAGEVRTFKLFVMACEQFHMSDA